MLGSGSARRSTGPSPSPRAPLAAPARWPRGTRGSLAFVSFISWSFNARALARWRTGTRLCKHDACAHPSPAPANFPACIPMSHTHRPSHGLVLPLQPCPPELSTLVSGPWRNPLFRLKPNLTISSFPSSWLLSHLTGHTQSISVRLRSDFPILGSSFLKGDGGPQSVSSTPQPGFGLFFPTSPSQHTPPWSPS